MGAKKRKKKRTASVAGKNGTVTEKRETKVEQRETKTSKSETRAEDTVRKAEQESVMKSIPDAKVQEVKQTSPAEMLPGEERQTSPAEMSPEEEKQTSLAEMSPEEERQTNPAVVSQEETGVAHKTWIENSTTVEETARRKGYPVFFFAVIGIGLAVLIGVLSLCLYHVSKDLKAVQAVSSALQKDLELAEANVQRLSEQRKEEPVIPEKGVPPTPVPTAMPTKALKPTPKPEEFTVCIDAGHGDHDPGAVLKTEDGQNRQEKDDNLWMSMLVKKELEAYGVKVFMTREDDTFLSLYDRTYLANSWDVDALISFHRNAYYVGSEMNDRVSGVEIWVHSSRPAASMELAEDMIASVMEIGGMKNRGVKYGSMSDFSEDYAINRRSLMTSMIVELGFISSPADNEAYDTYGEAYAKAMAKDIYDWLVKHDL